MTLEQLRAERGRKAVLVDHCPHCGKGLGICRIPNCERLSCTRGLCKAHYERLRRYGDVAASRPIRVWGTA